MAFGVESSMNVSSALLYLTLFGLGVGRKLVSSTAGARITSLWSPRILNNSLVSCWVARVVVACHVLPPWAARSIKVMCVTF